MNEEEFARTLVSRLNQGLGGIKQGTLYRLQTARNNALNLYREPVEPVGVVGWAGELAFRLGLSRYMNGRYVMALTLLLLSLLGVTYWRAQSNDIADIDAGLLTCELPISAYLDNDFEAWLKRPSH